MKKSAYAVLVCGMLAACVAPPAPPAPTAAVTAPSRVVLDTSTAQPEPASTVTPFPSLTPLPTETSTSTPSATPDPYEPLTIEFLSARDYGGGEIEVLEVMAENGWFTRYLIRYPSDGLWIYGFLNVPVPDGPAGPGPFPVIIALHGYIDPAIYNTLDDTTLTGLAATLAGR